MSSLSYRNFGKSKFFKTSIRWEIFIIGQTKFKLIWHDGTCVPNSLGYGDIRMGSDIFVLELDL